MTVTARVGSPAQPTIERSCQMPDDRTRRPKERWSKRKQHRATEQRGDDSRDEQKAHDPRDERVGHPSSWSSRDLQIAALGIIAGGGAARVGEALGSGHWSQALAQAAVAGAMTVAVRGLMDRGLNRDQERQGDGSPPDRGAGQAGAQTRLTKRHKEPGRTDERRGRGRFGRKNRDQPRPHRRGQSPGL